MLILSNYLTIQLDMVIGRCVIPVNAIFKTGLVIIRLSVDGGKNYPWWNRFYISQSFFKYFSQFEFTESFSITRFSYAVIVKASSESHQRPCQSKQQLAQLQTGQFDHDMAQL